MTIPLRPVYECQWKEGYTGDGVAQACPEFPDSVVKNTDSDIVGMYWASCIRVRPRPLVSLITSWTIIHGARRGEVIVRQSNREYWKMICLRRSQGVICAGLAECTRTNLSPNIVGRFNINSCGTLLSKSTIEQVSCR